MTAENDKVVSIHYTLKDDLGKLIDTSVGNAPLEYVQGRNYILPKLEEAILGKNVGDKVSVTLEPADGYGEYNDKLIAKVPRDNFEADFPIEVGMKFQAMTPSGPSIVTVKEVAENEITVDANHELAGVRLHFDVEVVEVRDATEDELASGMVGGGCGCGGCGGGCGEGGCGGDCNCDGGCEGCGN